MNCQCGLRITWQSIHTEDSEKGHTHSCTACGYIPKTLKDIKIWNQIIKAEYELIKAKDEQNGTEQNPNE